MEATELDQRLRAPASLPKNLGLIPSTHMAAHDHPVTQSMTSSSSGLRLHCARGADIHAGKTSIRTKFLFLFLSFKNRKLNRCLPPQPQHFRFLFTPPPHKFVLSSATSLAHPRLLPASVSALSKHQPRRVMRKSLLQLLPPTACVHAHTRPRSPASDPTLSP